MIYLWRGDLPLARAIDQGRLEVLGAAWASRGLTRWLRRTPLAHVGSQRPDAQAA